jgi:hypothetical protein
MGITTSELSSEKINDKFVSPMLISQDTKPWHTYISKGRNTDGWGVDVDYIIEGRRREMSVWIQES